MWISRHNTGKIEEAVKTRPVILLTGVRQAGKSSLLKQKRQKTIQPDFWIDSGIR